MLTDVCLPSLLLMVIVLDMCSSSVSHLLCLVGIYCLEERGYGYNHECTTVRNVFLFIQVLTIF